MCEASFMETEEYGWGEDEMWSKDDTDCTLYLKFPTAPPSIDEIMALHQDILHVEFPPQKKARFCYLVFASKAEAEEARKMLCTIVYQEKGKLYADKYREDKVNVGRGGSKRMKARRRSKIQQKIRRLWVTNIPKGTTNEQLKEIFPGCMFAYIMKKTPRVAICVFHNHKDAAAVVYNKHYHYINGAPISVEFKKVLTDDERQAKAERKKKKKDDDRQKGDDEEEPAGTDGLSEEEMQLLETDAPEETPKADVTKAEEPPQDKESPQEENT